jgi:hypothetical protein
MVLFFEAGDPSPSTRVQIARTTPRAFPALLEQFRVRQKAWATPRGDPWLVHASRDTAAVLRRLATVPDSLGNFCTANQGLRTGDNEKYLATARRGKAWKPAAGGRQIGRYEPIERGLFVRYEPQLLDAPRRPEIFTTPAKIVVQEVRNISLPRRIVATLDVARTFCLQSTNVVNLKADSPLAIEYILGVLNSSPVNFYFRCSFPGNNHIPSNQLLRIPIPRPTGKGDQGKLVALVRTILGLHRQAAVARRPMEKTLLARQIDATDRQIDGLVYELYGLTDKEIAIVEQAGK